GRPGPAAGQRKYVRPDIPRRFGGTAANSGTEALGVLNSSPSFPVSPWEPANCASCSCRGGWRGKDEWQRIVAVRGGNGMVMEEQPFAALAETHSAVVYFAGDRAFKLKKPVKLEFLDFSTRQGRAAACARETELNRRFAPDVYLGVAEVHGPDGRVCDHLV